MSGNLQTSCVVLAAALLGGCSTSASRLDFAPASSEQRAAADVGKEPPFLLHPVVDVRTDKGAIGFAGGRPFNAEGVTQWIDAEIRAMCAALPSPSGQASPIQSVSPRLHKLYVDSLSVNKGAVVVIEIETITADGKTSRRFYRGQSHKINWSNSDAEFRSALGSALADCLSQCRLYLANALSSAGAHDI